MNNLIDEYRKESFERAVELVADFNCSFKNIKEKENAIFSLAERIYNFYLKPEI